MEGESKYMKILYCHDGPMAIDRDGNAYPKTFTEEVLARYYNIADYFTMFVRTNTIDNKQIKDPVANMEKLNIVSSPNLASIKGIIFNRKLAKKLLKKEIDKCDALIIRLPSHISNLAVEMAKEMNKPYLIELVTCPWDALWNHSLKGKIIAPYMYQATKKRVREATHVVYVTNDFLQKRYPTNGKSVNCSNVALTEFDDSVIKKRLGKIDNFNKDKKVVIGTTAAVNVRFKGQQYVIEALGKLKKEGITNFEYHLVGGGEQKYLRAVAEKFKVTEQVKFLGALPHNEVFKWLETIDIYTQPSRQEGLPRALIEAMSRGLPAFGANTAGIPELLESKFIFSNTNKNIDEICNILKRFDKESMISQANRNYDESKKYDKHLIEERRSKFFKQFAKTKETD